MNNLATNNIQTINTNSAYNVIYNFMEKKRKSSYKTYETYIKHYNDFFGFICGKNLWSIDWNDILNITFTDVENFQLYMLNEKEWSISTCNQKLFAVKKLWDNLNRHNNNVNINILNFEELNDTDDNSYASLTREEVYLLIDFAKTKNKGDIQSMIFEFLFIVGCRKNVPFTLTKDMITRRYDFNAQKEACVISFIDKGNKKIDKAISDEFYEKIMSFQHEDKNKIFDVCSKTIENTFDEFRAKYNLYEKNGKKVVIHSIKKASGWSVYKSTGGDLQKTKEHMQHEHIELTSKTYLDSKDNYCSQGSYMLSKKISINDLQSLGEEKLLKVINSCGEDMINQIYYEAIKAGYIVE